MILAPAAWAQERYQLPDGTMLEGVETSSGALPRGSLKLFGLALDKSSFADLKHILGQASNSPRTNDPQEPDTICYSASSDPKIKLSLEAGWPENPTDKITSFTLTSGVFPHVGGSCASSRKLKREIMTSNGLRLGLTQSQLISIIGKPGKTTVDWIVYSFQNYREYSAIERARKPRAPGGGEFKGEYIYNYLTAHFTRGKLDFVEVSVGGEPNW